jgi:hypothetical protein
MQMDSDLPAGPFNWGCHSHFQREILSAPARREGPGRPRPGAAHAPPSQPECQRPSEGAADRLRRAKLVAWLKDLVVAVEAVEPEDYRRLTGAILEATIGLVSPVDCAGSHGKIFVAQMQDGHVMIFYSWKHFCDYMYARDDAPRGD